MFFFLVCHSPIGKAFTEAMQHSFEHRIDELIVIDVLPTDTPEKVSDFIQKKWVEKESPEQIVVLSDILGSTPSNGLHLWLSRNPVKYIGFVGINIPILLSAINHKDENIEVINKRMRKAYIDGSKQF